FNHLIKDYDYYEKQMVQKPVWNSAMRGNPQQALQDKGVINSGCSRHMTGNISFLSEFQEINGGYVAFGENPKETKYVVLSSDYKLPDENYVLLRVSRENSMYNVYLKYVVPLGEYLTKNPSSAFPSNFPRGSRLLRIVTGHPKGLIKPILGDLPKEPKKVLQTLKDPSWIKAIQEELLQFKLQKVWILVDLPKGKRAIGLKWVFRNKKDERGIVIMNKARLVAQGNTQEEGIDYDEVL
nr:putative ribonuclease H-like domain-containing protein [Tanacetum cinerariifolium]